MKKILFFVVLLVIVFHLTTGYCSTSSEIGRQILSKVLQTDYKNIEFVKKTSTSSSFWQAYLFRVKAGNVKQPFLLFVSKNNNYVIGQIFEKNKQVIPNLQPQDVAPQIENIDVSKLKKEDRMVINSNGKKTMFMFYNPDCPHCKNTMNKLANYSGGYKIIVKYVVSPMNMDHAESELSDYLVKTKNITKDQAKTLARKLIEEDFNDAMQAQIMGTPMFFDETGKYYPTIPDLK